MHCIANAFCQKRNTLRICIRLIPPHKIFSGSPSSAGWILNPPCAATIQSFNLSSNDNHSHQNIFKVCVSPFVICCREKCWFWTTKPESSHIKWLGLWGRWEMGIALIFCTQKGPLLLPLITSLNSHCCFSCSSLHFFPVQKRTKHLWKKPQRTAEVAH